MLMSLPRAYVPTPLAYQNSAYLGDILHKSDLVARFNTVSSPLFLELITGSSQAFYLQLVNPGYVPPSNPNGTPPSVHSRSTAFEYYYQVDSSFRYAYLQLISSES